MNKIQNNLKKYDNYFIYPYCLWLSIQIFICIFTVIASFVFASTVSLGSDESYTYINYVFPPINDSIHRVQIPNNHILNTVLIRLCEYITGERYNEFVIRLPNLIAHIIYAIFAFLFSREFKYRTLSIILLMCNWELTRYFGMARGYGLAACGVLAAAYFLYQWLYKTRHIYLYISCMTALSCSALANGATLYIAISMMLIIMYYVVKNKEVINYIKIKCNMIFILIFSCCIIFTFWVSHKEHVTYATKDFYDGFLLSIPIMFTPNVVFDDIIILFFIAIFIYGFKYSQIKLFHFIIIIYIIISISVDLLFGKGYPLHRGMLPIYPIVALLIIQSIQNINIKIIPVVFSVIILNQYFHNIRFDTSDTWACRRNFMKFIAENDIIKNKRYTSDCIKRMDISCEFYMEKFYYYINNTSKK